MKILPEIRSAESIMSDDRFFLQFNFEERNIIKRAMKAYAEQFIDKASQVVVKVMPEEGLYDIDRTPIENLKWEML